MKNAILTPLGKDEYFVQVFQEGEDPEQNKVLLEGKFTTPELRNLQEKIDNAIYP